MTEGKEGYLFTYGWWSTLTQADKWRAAVSRNRLQKLLKRLYDLKPKTGARATVLKLVHDDEIELGGNDLLFLDYRYIIFKGTEHD